jgi:hypothetical protein
LKQKYDFSPKWPFSHFSAENEKKLIGFVHRHLRIYRLLNGMYHLPCLLYQYCKWPLQQKKKRKEEAYPWQAGACSGHTTNLKQSILRLSISMVLSFFFILFFKN